MDRITKAYEYTTNVLPNNERLLADSIYIQEPQPLIGDKNIYRLAWRLAPALKLEDTLKKLYSDPGKDGKFDSQGLRVFCDTLGFSTGAQIEFGDTNGVVLEIYSRLIDYVPTSGTVPLKVRLRDSDEIHLHIPSLPDGFEIEITSVQVGSSITKSWTAQLNGKQGVLLKHQSGPDGFSATLLDAPITSLDHINYLDLIDSQGNVRDSKLLNEFYPRLLEMQFLIASAHVNRDADLARELLKYIISSTVSPRSIELNYRALGILNSLKSGDNTHYVSPLNVYACDQILKSRLVAAVSFEQAFRDFASQSANSGAQVDAALNVLSKEQDTLELYSFQKRQKLKEFSDADESQKLSEKNYAKISAEVDSTGETFKQKLQEWKKKKEEDARTDLILSIVDIGFAIGMAIATGGVDTAAIVKAGGKAVEAAEKAKEAFEKLVKIFKLLEKISKDIRDSVTKITAVIKKAKEVADLVKATDKDSKSAATLKTSDALKPSDGSLDVQNITASWSDFEVAVNRLEKDMDEIEVDGKAPYIDAMRKMVIHGKTVILTKAAVAQKGDELAVILLQETLGQKNSERLRVTVSNVQKSGAISRVLMLAMYDRLVAIRGLVFLDFWTYETAYRFHTLLNESPIEISPVKPITDFLQDATALQAAVLNYGSQILIQKRTFQVRSLCGFPDAASLKKQFEDQGFVTFTLDPLDKVWKNYYRVRMERVRCYLEGVKAKDAQAGSVVRLELSTGGSFFDNDFKLLDYANEDRCSPARAYISEPRTLTFEYDTANPSYIPCDGDYGQARDYTMHTPLTTWTIEVLDAEDGTIGLDELDLSGLTGVRMEFLCEFTRPNSETVRHQKFINQLKAMGVAFS